MSEQKKFAAAVDEMAEEIREALMGMMGGHLKIDGLVFATALVKIGGMLCGGAIRKAGCRDQDYEETMGHLVEVFEGRARSAWEAVGGKCRYSMEVEVEEESEVQHLMMGVVVNRGKKTIEIDPRFWEDVGKAPQEVQEEVKRVVGAMQEAAGRLGPEASQEDFLAEVEKISGFRPERADLPEDVQAEFRRRVMNPVRKH